MPLEIELKLSITAADIPRFLAHPLLQQKTPRIEQLHTTYFDTPTFELRKQGYVLRIRKINDQFIQTIKTSNASVDGLHERQEWEFSVPSLQPDYHLFPVSDLRQQLLQTDLGSRVKPLFYSDFQRHSWLLQFPDDCEIELALDQGRVVSENLQDHFTEIELELKSGHRENLQTIAAIFAKDIALKPENISKANRGFKLATALG